MNLDKQTVEKPVKKERKELVAAREDKGVVKGVGFNLQMNSSENGKSMIDAQRDSRRQRHLQSVRD